MKRLILFTICASLVTVSTFGQNAGVTLGDSNKTTDGTIRYKTATGFEGLHLGNWQPLFGANNAAGLWSSNGSSAYYNSGNVGIGINTPAYKLDVNGPVGTGAIFTNSNRVEINSNGTGDRFGYIDLHSSDVETDYSARIARWTGENGGFAFYNKGTGDFSFIQEGTGNMLFRINNITRMFIKNDGKIGIGTSTPTQFLDVTGDVATGAIFTSNGQIGVGKNGTGDRHAFVDLYSSNTEWSGRLIRWAGANGGLDISQKGTGALALNHKGAGDIKLRTNNIDRMRIKADGKVGIGTNNPTQVLDVNGDVATGAIFTSNGQIGVGKNETGDRNAFVDLYSSNTVWSGRFIRWAGANGGLDISQKGTGALALNHTGAGDIKFLTNSLDRMRIKADGKVGIGTNNPTQTLDVNGGVATGPVIELGENGSGNRNAYMDFHSQDNQNYNARIVRWQGANGGFDITQKGTGDIALNHTAAGGIKFLTNNLYRMRINADGKVEIGTVTAMNTPGIYRLYVQYGILTEKVKVATVNSGDWADYVFAEDYHLNGIEEVEQFVKTNKHLPNVPSAKEVEKNGVDMVEMDATLLRQIEELWLHVIELKKDNENIKAENQILKNRVNTLENK